MSNSSSAPCSDLGNRNWFCIVVLNVSMAFALGYSAAHCSPLLDEPAHFASGVILAYHSDAGNFRVNPPTHKWITAIAMLFTSEMKLPPIIASSHYGNSSRPEFDLGDSVIKLNQGSYLNSLVWARYARIPMMLLGSWLLFIATKTLPPSRRMLCQVFWCTSPLLLGHGWVVSADAPAAIAMCAILVTTIQLWKWQTASQFVWSGIAWGIAIGTKFTFGPLYLMFIPLFYFCSPRRPAIDRAKEPKVNAWIRCAGNWALHGLTACITLNALYCFDSVGVPIGKHDFVSQAFSKWKSDPTRSADANSIRTWIARVPSPFPKVFLEGVDQQMADMDRPRGAYWMGERIQGPIHWFHLAGYFVKEQIAVWLAIGLAIIATVITALRPRTENDPLQDPLRASTLEFCLLTILGFACFMTTQCNLVWNIRYLTPALPLIYVLVAGSIPKMGFSIPSRSPIRYSDVLPAGLALVAVVEFLGCFPHYFSYTNPFFGGSHRVPMALHDSNFDYGQDLFYVRRWIAKQKAARSDGKSLKVYGLVSGHGRLWMEDMLEPASIDHIESVIQSRNASSSQVYAKWVVPTRLDDGKRVLIVSRGLFAAEPWADRYSTLQDHGMGGTTRKSLRELSVIPPDEFITPVLIAYWLD